MGKDGGLFFLCDCELESLEMSVADIVIPTVCFVVIGITHCYEWFQGERSDYTKGFFRRVRKGWIASNFMKGQAAVNTTRDYSSVIL